MDDSEDEDYIYGFSDEDVAWGELESSDTELEDEAPLRGVEINSDDGLFDYGFGDECGEESSDDGKTSKEDRARGKAFGQILHGIEFHRLPGEKIKLEKGHLFENVKHFRDVLRDYAVQECFKLVRDKNEKKKVTVHCAIAGCCWRVHASPLFDNVTYQIKKIFKEHTCVKENTSKEVTSTWIASKFADRIRKNPEMKIGSLKAAVKTEYGIEPSRMQLYRAKRKALDYLKGNHAEAFTLLPSYAIKLDRTNPGSLVIIKRSRPDLIYNHVFNKIFICLEALATGLKKGCRLFIGLDGCHLKGPYGGVLLGATALDGNNGLFPLAYAVVASEGRDSWGFFLTHLQTMIGTELHGIQWTFMSHQQKGLDSAMSDIFPTANHRFYCRHLFNNFKKKYPGLLIRKYFWKAAIAYNRPEFEDAMQHIRNMSQEGYNHLMELPVALWSRHAFDENVKNDHVTNNLSESFNNWVGAQRGNTILGMLEWIRMQLMGRIQKRYEVACSWETVVTPNIRKRLNQVMEQSRQCSVIFAGGNEFEVLDKGRATVIDLGARSCICRAWQISGIPCKHAAATMAYKRMNVELYCDGKFTTNAYLEAHGKMIHPIPDYKLWQHAQGDPLQPPPPHRKPGRPKKVRRREADEPVARISEMMRSMTVRCTICKSFGHNKRTCPSQNFKRGSSQPTNATTNVSMSQSQIGATSSIAQSAITGRGVSSSQPIPGTSNVVAETSSDRAMW